MKLAGYRAASRAGAVDSAVVYADQGAVHGQTDIAFDRIGSLLNGPQVRGHRMLGLGVIGSTVGNHLRHTHCLTVPYSRLKGYLNDPTC